VLRGRASWMTVSVVIAIALRGTYLEKEGQMAGQSERRGGGSCCNEDRHGHGRDRETKRETRC